MSLFTIGIPTWEYNGKGVEVLNFSFTKMINQNFKDFDIFISDHSQNNKIRDLCNEWGEHLNITHEFCENGRGKVAPNLNNVLRHAKSSGAKWIKLLDQDDFLYDIFSLERYADVMLETDKNWIATSYFHTMDRVNLFNLHVPTLNPNLFVVNTIGTCSCTAFRIFDDMPEFDENLSYCHDCLFYHQYWKKYGDPEFLYVTTILNFLWKDSVTSRTTQEDIEKENKYLIEKYGGKLWA